MLLVSSPAHARPHRVPTGERVGMLRASCARPWGTGVQRGRAQALRSNPGFDASLTSTHSEPQSFCLSFTDGGAYLLGSLMKFSDREHVAHGAHGKCFLTSLVLLLLLLESLPVIPFQGACALLSPWRS